MGKFSENLKSLMKEKRLTARHVSKQTGIPESTLSEWCGGREAKFNDSILKLARFLGVSVEFLLTGREPESEIVGDLVEELAEGFTTIHKGVYRLKVEKFTGSKKRED